MIGQFIFTILSNTQYGRRKSVSCLKPSYNVHNGRKIRKWQMRWDLQCNLNAYKDILWMSAS